MKRILALAVAAIPVGTRVLAATTISGFHEYEAIFIYGSDILLLLFLGFAFWKERPALMRALHQPTSTVLMFFLLFAASSILVAHSPALALYAFVRLVTAAAFAFAVGRLAADQKVFRLVLATIAMVALAQAFLGLWQFSTQASVGLQMLGEPVLVPYTGSASTISTDGARVLRAYGTFPHPNIFAMFELLGAFSLLYWYLWFEQELARELFGHPRGWWTFRRGLATLQKYLTHPYFFGRLVVTGAMFFIILALLVSFSRGAWIAGITGFVALLVLRGRHQPGGTIRMMQMVAVCAVVGYLMFASFISARAQFSAGEPAVTDRAGYTDVAADIIAHHPLGVGIGNQVLDTVQSGLYAQYGFSTLWSWEPIHNLYLLVASELGWLGVLSFLTFLGMVGWRLLKRTETVASDIMIALLIVVLMFGLADHFFWTLQPGRLMFWLVIGLALSQLAPKAKV